MFEKEGIKYAIEETVGTECLSMPIEDFHFIDLAESQQEKAQCFKDGAEFGYNKANEEMQKNGLALQSDMDKTIEQNIVLKKELNKANKWHYVKDGDLPKGEGTYFAVWQNDNGYKEIFIMKYEEDEDDEEEFHWLDGDYEVQDEYVIAWKEIVLPKEIKEND